MARGLDPSGFFITAAIGIAGSLNATWRAVRAFPDDSALLFRILRHAFDHFRRRRD